MKLMAVALLALVGAVAASSNAGPDGSAPVDRIVVLLKTLQDTITKDGENEQMMYDRNACWCETTAKKKASAIEEAQDEMRSLGQRILQLKGMVATFESEIAEYTTEINDLKDEMAARTSVRQKENAAYMAEADETKLAMASLEKAIQALADGSRQEGALLQESSRTQSRNAVRDVLDKLPSRTPSLPAPRVALLSEFVQATSGYAPQSATIQGILGDMYTTFATNLEASTETEANQNAKFEKRDAQNTKTMGKLEDSRDATEEKKSEAEAMLADTSSAYDATEKQMKADIAFFDNTKEKCQDEHFAWENRSRARNHELAGIRKAIGILTSDANRELFDKSIKPGVEQSFLQIDTTGASAKAYNILKAQARKTQSLELAALAVQVRTSKAGHFDKVIGSIDAMAKTLNEEGADDKSKKDECKDEYQTNTQEQEDLKWKIRRNDAKIAKLDGLIELRRNQKADTEAKIAETRAAVKDMKAQRKESRDAMLQAEKEDRAAITVLESAKTALARPSVGDWVKILKTSNTKDVASKLIGKTVQIREDVRNHQPYRMDAYKICEGCSEPFFYVDDVQLEEAPAAQRGDENRKVEMRSEGEGGRYSGASKTILALFASIIEDLHNEIDNTWKDEAQETKVHLKDVASAEQLIEDLIAKKDTLASIIATRVQDKEREVTTKNGNSGDLAGKEKYRAEITPDCDWILKNFKDRATARASEMEGLEQAKAFLAGQTALISKASPSLAQIRFLGMH